MTKGQISPKQFSRFKKIDAFLKKVGRMPVNREVGEMFKLKSLSATHLTLKQYTKHKRSNPSLS